MNEKNILAKTYTDLATIYRKQPSKDADGITSNAFQSLFEGIPCALSKKEFKSTIRAKDGSNYDIKYDSALFTSPDNVVKAGDKIVITLGANSEVRTAYAGEPMVYVSHQQIPLERDERA